MSTDTPTTTGANDLRIVKDPTTPKEKAIIDAVLDDPNASNPAIAERVESELGEAVSASWVSRVRSSFVREADADQYDTSKVDDVVARLDRLESAVDEAATDDDFDRVIAAVEGLTESVETLIAEVRDVRDTVDLIEDMVARDINDDVVAYVLKKELDRVDGADATV